MRRLEDELKAVVVSLYMTLEVVRTLTYMEINDSCLIQDTIPSGT